MNLIHPVLNTARRRRGLFRTMVVKQGDIPVWQLAHIMLKGKWLIIDKRKLVGLAAQTPQRCPSLQMTPACSSTLPQ